MRYVSPAGSGLCHRASDRRFRTMSLRPLREHSFRAARASKRFLMLLQAMFLLIAFSAPSFAQKESLLIGPGDQLHIEVFDTPEMEQLARVTDAGMIPLIFVGEVKVAGMTPGDAGHQIEQVLKAKGVMLHPQVSLTVQQYATQNVYVMGQVTTPGAYPITTPTSVVDVLALAGGLVDLADRHITVERRSDPSEKVHYFLSNRSDEALDSKVFVYPGDTVLVPRVGVIYVRGDVGKPGGYPMTTNSSEMSVLQSLAMAGSANKTAMLSKAKLVRHTPNGPQEVPIVIDAMQKGKQPDIQMQADDILFIPASWLKNLTQNASQIIASAASASIYAHP
jgi:polysaccharide export outer membrane protein